MPGIFTRLLYAALAAVVIWLLKIAACRGALRVQRGTGPATVDPEEVGWRSMLAAAGLTLISPIEIYAWDTAFRSGLRDPVFWVIGFAVVPLGGLFLTWAYAFDDFLQGLNLFALYSVVPALVLWILWLAKVPALSMMLRIF